MLDETGGANRHELRGPESYSFNPSGMTVALDEWELRDTVYEYDSGTGGVSVVKHMRNGEDGGSGESTDPVSDIGASGGFGVLGAVTGLSTPNMRVVAVAIKWDAEPGDSVRVYPLDRPRPSR
jgi:hypothetical protein